MFVGCGPMHLVIKCETRYNLSAHMCTIRGLGIHVSKVTILKSLAKVDHLGWITSVMKNRGLVDMRCVPQILDGVFYIS